MRPEQPVRVVSDGLLLREFRSDDEPDLLRAFLDPEIRLWNPQATDAAGVAAWAGARNNWSDGRHASWAVERGGRVVGSVSLHKIDVDQGDSEIGYWTAPWARGQGAAVEAVTAAASYAYGTLGLHRLHLYHAVENAASCVVATRARFQLEGTLRQSYRFGDGRRHDEHLHARLASD